MKKIIILFLLAALTINGFAFGRKGEPNYRSPFLPDHIVGQFAGNIGVLSAGFGYQSFSGKLSSDILIGYVPPFMGGANIITISQKNTFRGRNLRINKLQSFYPSLGFSINIETGNNSFLKLPGDYPEGYYSTNALKFGLFAGLNHQGKIQNDRWYKQFEYFAEVGTLGSYVYYNIMRKEYLNPDIFSLALGLRIKLN